MGDDTALRAALRAVATPDLYRRNAFRMTGLDTPHGGVAGLAVAAPVAAVPLEVTPLAEIEAARRRLGSRVTRAVDEFFWFWPEGPGQGDDAGLAALRAFDVARADAAWEAAGTDVAHHNLAVLNHLLALDTDHEVRVAAQWRRAYRFWLRTWRSDPFWDAYGARAGAATAATMRAELPLVLARVGAAVAVRWAERRQTDDMVKAHWQLVEYDGFPDDVRAAARRAAADAVIARIGDRVEEANDAVRRMPMNVARIARSLHDAVLPAVDTLELGPTDRHTAVRDAVAEQLLKYTVVYYEQTEDWGEGLKLLYLARNLGSYRIAHRIDTYARELERERDADQRRVGPGHRYYRLPTFHRPVPDLGNLGWPRDLG